MHVVDRGRYEGGRGSGIICVSLDLVDQRRRRGEEDVEELVIDWIRYRRIGSLVVFARLVRTGRTALLLIFDQSQVKRPP
jgi:hypothetical protein